MNGGQNINIYDNQALFGGNNKSYAPFYYHGTTTPGITELRANPAAYLTPNRAYALFYIIDKEINWVTCGVKEDGIVHYDERFKNQAQKLYAGKSAIFISAKRSDCSPRVKQGGLLFQKVLSRSRVWSLFRTYIVRSKATKRRGTLL